MTSADILGLLVALQIKHMLADFWWQTPWMVANKGRFGHPAGFAHAGIHGALTFAILLALAVFAPVTALLVAVAEGVLHYLIDWTKEYVTRHRAPDLADGSFWRAIGADQLAHQLTYVAILGLALHA